MNRLMDDLFEIVISILGAAVFAVFLYAIDLITLKHIIAFIIPIVIVITITMLIINRYRKIGLCVLARKK